MTAPLQVRVVQRSQICVCAYMSRFCVTGELQLFPEKAVTATISCTQVFHCKFLHTSVDRDFMCIRLGQRTLRWKEGIFFRRYKVLVKPILNLVWLESIIGASSRRGWRWDHITSALLLFSPDQTRPQLDEKLQQSSKTFIFKPLPARGGYTEFYRALFKYPSLWFRFLWVLPLCTCAQKSRYPAETVIRIVWHHQV